MEQNYKMLKSNQIDYAEFKIMIISFPEEPEIKEHNYYEDYLKEKEQVGGMLAPDLGDVSPNNYQFDSNNPSSIQQSGNPLNNQPVSPEGHSNQLPSPRSREPSGASHSPFEIALNMDSEFDANRGLPRSHNSHNPSSEVRQPHDLEQPAIRIEPPSFVSPSEDSRVDRRSDRHSIGQQIQPATRQGEAPNHSLSHNSSASNPFASVPNIRPPVRPQDPSLKSPSPSNLGSRLEPGQLPQQPKPISRNNSPSSFGMEVDENPRDQKTPASLLKPSTDSSGQISKKRLEMNLSPKLGILRKSGDRMEASPNPDPAMIRKVERDFENDQQMAGFRNKMFNPKSVNAKEMENYLDRVDQDNKQMKGALKNISENLNGLSQEQQREKNALLANFGKMHEESQKLRSVYGENIELLKNPALKTYPLSSAAVASSILESVEASFGEVVRKVAAG